MRAVTANEFVLYEDGEIFDNDAVIKAIEWPSSRFGEVQIGQHEHQT